MKHADETEEHILRLLKLGMPGKAIAKRFNVSEKKVAMVKREWREQIRAAV